MIAFVLRQLAKFPLVPLFKYNYQKDRADYYRAQALRLDQREDQLVEKYNNLAAEYLRVEMRLSIAKANQPRASSGGQQFTDEELRSLLQLVHPDKHDGKQSAVVLTQKINKLRGK